MKLDMTRYARMPMHVRDDLHAWLVRAGLVLTDDDTPGEQRYPCAVRLLGMDEAPDFPPSGFAFEVERYTGRLVGRGKNRGPEIESTVVTLGEFPPESTWRYFTNGAE